MAQNSNHLFRPQFCRAVLPFLAGLTGTSVISYWVAWGADWPVEASAGLTHLCSMWSLKLQQVGLVQSGGELLRALQGLLRVRLNSPGVTSTEKSQGPDQMQGVEKEAPPLKGRSYKYLG